MRAFVTGAAGMLGSSLVPILKDCGHTVMATDLNYLDGIDLQLDVRDLPHLLEAVREFKPDTLIHLAAETDLETCEARVDYAYQENCIGTQNACVACLNLDIPLAYISTAGVFDGKKDGPYTEFDQPNPVNVYGASKLQGEKVVRDLIHRHFVVRAGWMVGGGSRDKKFVHKIISQIEDGQNEIHAVTDRKGTPTYAPAFSRMLEKIIRMKIYGTYHLACRGEATRYEVTEEILRILGRSDIKLTPVTSDYFKEEYFAPRPYSESLTNYVLELRSLNDMPLWADALEEYLRESFSGHF